MRAPCQAAPQESRRGCSLHSGHCVAQLGCSRPPAKPLPFLPMGHFCGPKQEAPEDAQPAASRKQLEMAHYSLRVSERHPDPVGERYFPVKVLRIWVPAASSFSRRSLRKALTPLSRGEEPCAGWDLGFRKGGSACRLETLPEGRRFPSPLGQKEACPSG